MRIALGTDHAGFIYKEAIKHWLQERGHLVIDFGTTSTEPVDYPLFIRPAVEAIVKGEADRAVVLGGSGNGEAIAANRVKGVRCALCWNVATAELARKHNDANAISLGARMVELDMALAIVETWLATAFEGGRHAKRIQMLDEGLPG
jgi:ribose 5-phosphate isomerase B